MVQKFVERQNMFKEEHVIKTCISYRWIMVKRQKLHVLSASERFRIDHFLPVIDQFTAELTEKACPASHIHENYSAQGLVFYLSLNHVVMKL